jgi:hypothetical protein
MLMADTAHVSSQASLTSGFMESVREPRTAYISPKRFSEALGVPANSFASLIGLHRNTLRNPASPRLQDKLREMARAITAAAGLTGDIQRALYWYRNQPISDYGYKTAAELVAAGHADAVMDYLRDLENGANG